MKDVEIELAIRADPSLLALVHRANESLEAGLGRSSGTVSASWRLLEDDRGRPFLQLIISDWSGRAEAVFAPDDLKNDRYVQGRMIRLWGDLLEIRSHKLLEEIRAASTAAEGA